MGLTIVQKSNLRAPRKHAPNIALVLAGGAISGGAFKLGGLIALNTYLENKKVTDFQMYVGVSAGAFLAAPLSAGVPPEELIRSIHGRSSIITQFRPIHFYYPNFSEFLSKPVDLVHDAVTFFPEVSRTLWRSMSSTEGKRRFRRFMSQPSYPNLELLMAPVIRDVLGVADLERSGLSYLPSGLFDNTPIEHFIRENLRRNRLPNNFRLMHLERHNSLYITATNLNTAKVALFGHDEDTSATISEAVQASTAIPGYFRPVRIAGEEYVDGGVRRTANISRASQKGADLIICYNPFRPIVYHPDRRPGSKQRSMGEMGPAMVLNQVFRTLLHSRLELGVERLALEPRFKGDLLVIEPTETDARMFNISPLAFWKRAEAAEAGFLSAKQTIERHHEKLAPIFEAYGIRTNLKRLKEDETALRLARDHDEEVFEVLQHDAEAPRPHLQIVR